MFHCQFGNLLFKNNSKINEAEDVNIDRVCLIRCFITIPLHEQYKLSMQNTHSSIPYNKVPINVS